MADYFAMDGFAAYIWPAYGLSVVALGGLIAFILIEARAAKHAAAEWSPAGPDTGAGDPQ